MFLYLIKILLWFLAINYSFVLLKEIHKLKRYKFIHALCFISLTVVLIFHYNFFHSILKFPNSQIFKLVTCILLIRVPVAFLRWLLIDTIHLSIDKEDTVKLSRAGWYPIRAANRGTVTNGIATFKPEKKNLIWALMLLLLCGNWISHHPVLCISVLCAFCIYKNSLRILNFLKIAWAVNSSHKANFACAG
jgi:hypothetical protein